MRPHMKLVLGLLAFSTASFGQILNLGVPDAFQVNYAANTNAAPSNDNTFAESFINITNTGASILPDPVPGTICVNIYTFDPSAELLSCCACAVTPNGLASLGVDSSLLNNSLTGQKPSSAVIKLIATEDSGTCDPTSVTAAQLAPGMRAWRTTPHVLTQTPITFGLTETEFTQAQLSAGELAHLTTFCSFITANGTGAGICKGCTMGALGAVSSQ